MLEYNYNCTSHDHMDSGFQKLLSKNMDILIKYGYLELDKQLILTVRYYKNLGEITCFAFCYERLLKHFAAPKQLKISGPSLPLAPNLMITAIFNNRYFKRFEKGT